MLQTESQSLQAPGIGDRILHLRNNASLDPYIVAENKDSALGVFIEFQESDDNTTWATIVETSVAIDPGKSNGQVIQTGKKHIALFAQGNVLLDVHVVRHRNGVNSILD